MYRISVIIPTYKRPRLLARCLESLKTQAYPKDRFEVIVVDDGSGYVSAKTVRLFLSFLNLRYFYQQNRGPSAARNLGLSKANGEIIAFIDDDCIADKYWLSHIAMFYDTYPAIEVIQGRLKLFHTINPIRKLTQATTRFADEKRIVVVPHSYIENYALFFGAGNAAIRKSTILKYSLFFDEALRTKEDTDLYRRIKKSGLDIVYNKNMIVTHLYQSNIIGFFKRRFKYGRGKYHLRKKWEGESYTDTPNASFTFDKLVRWYGLFWAIIIWMLNVFKNKVHNWGFGYEKWLDHSKTTNVSSLFL